MQKFNFATLLQISDDAFLHSDNLQRAISKEEINVANCKTTGRFSLFAKKLSVMITAIKFQSNRLVPF